MRTLVLLIGLAFLAIACQPPCEPVNAVPSQVCHRSTDGGTIVAGAPFTLEAQTHIYGGTCTVSVEDGGSINVLVAGNSCGTTNAASAIRVVPNPVPCEVPALQEGTYTVNSQVPVTFSLPASGGDVPPCY